MTTLDALAREASALASGKDHTGENFPPSCRMSSFTEVDFTGRYDLTEKVAITGSVMNAFDRKAPFDPLNYASFNYNPTYAQSGAVGRFYTVGVKVKL